MVHNMQMKLMIMLGSREYPTKVQYIFFQRHKLETIPDSITEPFMLRAEIRMKDIRELQHMVTGTSITTIMVVGLITIGSHYIGEVQLRQRIRGS